jgi:opacity protein-like surface antigen
MVTMGAALWLGSVARANQEPTEEMPAGEPAPPSQGMAPSPQESPNPNPASPCPPGYVESPECGQHAMAPPAAPPPPAHPQARYSRFQMAVSAGGGASNYFGDAMKGSDAGGAWDARVLWGTRFPVGFEAAYVGSVNTVEGAVQNGHVTSQGFDTDVRLQLPYRVQPYIFGGVGYNHMSLSNDGRSDPALAAQYQQNSSMLAVPAGGGLSGYLGRHVMLDARFTYRALLDNKFDRSVATDSAHQWTALGRVGYAF